MASKSFLLHSRRAYTVAAENVKVQTSVASAMRKQAASETVKGEVFWMRDPKTGYYIPETHFDQIDAADLRHKFLSKKVKPSKVLT